MLLNTTSPQAFGGTDADYGSVNDFDFNAAILPFGSATHEEPPNEITDSFAATYDGFSPEGLDGFGWRDQENSESLPAHRPSQFTQIHSGYSSWSTTSAPCEAIDNRESISTPPLLENSFRGQLPRRKSKYLIQEINQETNVVFIPNGRPADPLERWKESPPEAEAASLSAIKNALQNQPLSCDESQGPGTPGFRSGDIFQNYRPTSQAPSSTSGGSAISASSQRSNRSRLSTVSRSSQAASDQASAKARKKQTGLRTKKRSSASSPRIFCCTFCCDKFKSKFDWMRHEKSLHLNLESWACAPFGGCVVLPSTGRAHCAYCNQLDPTLEHLQKHNHGLCQPQLRTFRRKDHLIQHLRLFHHLDTIPLIDDWKRTVTNFPSRCGFCESRMHNWDERADHLVSHFRKGCTMAQWKGDHDFPPEIAAQVTHSVPPYLIDFESRTFVPFSATNGAVNDHLSQMLSRATFLDAAGERQMFPESPQTGLQPVQETQLDSYTEVLTRHLSHYAQRMMINGIIPTDEMFQLEARRLLFDSEDQWNQTLADNVEWLAKFRGEHSSNGAFQTPGQSLVNR
ncbi:hypothetical protein IFM5058_08794 [Aspergillus udagawae]|nr:hypothetical protein IFM5058_08794 [Aspergillus udagawae]